MKLESQVCSLELSKKLFTLGVKQNALCFWYDEVIPPKVIFSGYEVAQYGGFCSAFTVAELMDILPETITIDEFYKDMNLTIQKETDFYKGWHVWYEANYYTQMDEYCSGEKLADCLAKMLIYLIENKLLSVTL